MTLVLTGATLIDGTGAAPVPDAAVVIDGERIIAAGPRRGLAWPADAQVMDVAGRTLLPGLIDAHDHLASHGYGLATRFGLDEPASTAHMRTARVLVGDPRHGLHDGPRRGRARLGLQAGRRAGTDPGAAPRAGDPDHLADGRHRRSREPVRSRLCCAVFDPLLPNSVANGPDAVRDVVRTMVRAGADVIKTATTGGASSRPGHGPKDAAFSLEEMQALVTESHALGRRVMCHALGGPGLRTALAAGVDSIEHGSYLDEEPEMMAQMAERGVFLVPTLTVYVYHRESQAPHVRARARELYQHHVATVQRALELGVPIAAGTDAGGHGHPKNALEIVYLVEAGLTPMQALRAATQWAAKCLGLERELGTVEKGRLADLVVVDGNPLDDVKVLLEPERIQLVVKGGAVCVDRRPK